MNKSASLPAALIKPVLVHDALLADVQAAAGERDRFQLWWLGQSGFLLQWRGEHVLLDPYLSDSLARKYAATDKPHERMTELVIAPERLNFVSIVTATHAHTDHFDADTLNPLRAANPALRLIIPEALRDFAVQRLGCARDWPLGLDDGASVTLGAFRFTGVAAAHEELERDPEGRCKFLGYLVQFGPWTIYHSGDTVRYAGMEARLRRQRVDVALLPINGRAPERRVAGNLWGREAAQLAHDAHLGLVIPCHYEMFRFNSASLDEFTAECRRLEQPFARLRCGERLSRAAA